MKNRKILIIITIVLALLAIIAAVIISFIPKPPTKQADTMPQVTTPVSSEPAPTPSPAEDYIGQEIAVGNEFKVKVPNGWRASVSTQPSFLAIQFARPGQLELLAYNKAATPEVDYDGIPPWGGLTEHFYIRSITSASQAFKPADHAEVTQEQFTFADGTIGTKYSVIKHAAEAERFGGLLKGSEWYGRVFVYEKGNKRIEAHLAYYPSTKIDAAFYAAVSRTLKL